MGRRQKHEVVLTTDEREQLIKGTKCGDWSPREIKRAQMLLSADKNNSAKKDQEIAKELHCCQYTVTKLRERFMKKGAEGYT